MNARVKYPNTPESDAMPMVPHIVEKDDGTKVEVIAADPLDAIKRVKRGEGLLVEEPVRRS